MKLNVKASALAWGLFWALCGAFIPWWVILFDGATGESVLGTVFRGYDVSPRGSLVGALWGFGCGAVSGGAFALLYNILVARFDRRGGGRPTGESGGCEREPSK